mmetsp:Transcript_36176/g.53037  ORF Transcript_36176/g.53037 Transcript_36176/m.53037 type:complete len:401 (-) Transcript_36176:73-1275(-)|eukprot:CAMPEP_0195508964 /NCGR_PEP_ID=MMETSP0794_2-20130614/2041_1 /TAXON_ID=515487 /ORGANISM="Stephanopyxis turris, Strain CCMP 815" /LENGTH=400 /DNA_ID=CAMNT_0040636069 /DNA_START=125 /DNA_END=1327 /DNA_ORIENTATION=+
MHSSSILIFAVAYNIVSIDGFAFHRNRRVQLPQTTKSDTDSTVAEIPVKKTGQKLGLLTFDLDDTLYPIAPVIYDANGAFVKAMERFGYGSISRDTILSSMKKIREEMSLTDPEKAACLTHTEIRKMGIRSEMEKVCLERKLQATADEWATNVESLTHTVVQSAVKWAAYAVSDSIVEAVLTAWEMERHHSAERHLYPEVIDALKQIKEEHPGVIIGAVTDGRANPMFMTFTLAPYFDFCMSWEDDQGARSRFFKDLGSVEKEAELTWIYEGAVDKYKELAKASAEVNAAAADSTGADKKGEGYVGNDLWIHVGDDLAYDVGGSSACGAKTILLDLADEYGQTAKKRFDSEEQPMWSTSTIKELGHRRILNEKAEKHVDIKVKFLTQLPAAINKLLKDDE